MTHEVPRPLDPEDVVPAAWVQAAIDAVPEMTQAELARRLHMTDVAINRWVRGKVALSPARWAAIKGVLGLPADWAPGE